MKKYLQTSLILAGALAAVFIVSKTTRNQTIYDYKPGQSTATEQDVKGYYIRAQELQGKDANKSSVTFLATGDIMLSRSVAGTVQKNGGKPTLPFEGMAAIFKDVDFSFGNLESPFSGKDEFKPSGSMVFNAPRYMIEGLRQYKFQILNLANNHAFDQGEKGLDYTTKYLDENGIKHVGVGATLEEAWSPEIVELNGIRIGFIGASYASINDNGATINDRVARIEDVEKMKSVVEFLKTQADYVVVTMHAGTEYTRKPNQAQQDFARAAIDAGADMVIGAHPHWVQTIEQYNGKYIFYSLGNFIFDQEWSQDTKEGLTLKVHLSKPMTNNLQGPRIPAKLDSVELVPVIIENYSTPRPANLEESRNILQKIGQSSSVLR